MWGHSEEKAAEKIRRVKLTRSILIAGEHADAGTTHDLPESLAVELVRDLSAKFVDEEPQQPKEPVVRKTEQGDRITLQ